MVKRGVNIMSDSAKRDAFKRIAAKRTNSVLEKLSILGKCANRKNYEYGDDDVKKMFRAIDAELREVKSKFKNPKQTKFEL